MQGYVMSVRAVRSGSFVGEFGPTRFLVVPAGLTPAPSQGISASPWYKAVRTDAVWKNAARPDRRDILIVVHGYKMSETEIMQRHRSLRDDLLLLAESGRSSLRQFDPMRPFPEQWISKKAGSDCAFKPQTNGDNCLGVQGTHVQLKRHSIEEWTRIRTIPSFQPRSEEPEALLG